MDWFTLDNQLRRNQIIEGFNSFIWTERYSAYGDFQIVIPSTPSTRSMLALGTWIGMNLSDRMMIIDTISDVTDASTGARNMTVTGKSLEALLLDRVAMPALASTTATPNWVLTGTPGNIAREIFLQVCVNGAISQEDTIPFYTIGSISEPGNLGESTDLITISASPDSVYNTLQSLCNTYNLGFRFVKNGDSGQVYFEIYTGNNLTSTQSVLNAVIFDPDFDNLSGINIVSSTASQKTVAYVFAQNGSVMVYSPFSNASYSGTNRRVLLVNSSNTSPAGAALTMALQQEGLQALASQTLVYSMDGEIPPSVPFTYGVDYNLGDLVEERTSNGFGNYMLVTEQIFSSDSSGEKSYPTLSALQGITPGSWAAWTPGTGTWAQVSPTVTWANV